MRFLNVCYCNRKSPKVETGWINGIIAFRERKPLQSKTVWTGWTGLLVIWLSGRNRNRVGFLVSCPVKTRNANVLQSHWNLDRRQLSYHNQTTCNTTVHLNTAGHIGKQSGNANTGSLLSHGFGSAAGTQGKSYVPPPHMSKYLVSRTSPVFPERDRIHIKFKSHNWSISVEKNGLTQWGTWTHQQKECF